MKPEIMIAILTDGWHRREITQWLLSMVVTEGRYQLNIQFAYDVPVASCRNKIVRRFLATGCTHLLMVDSDQIIQHNLLDLIAHDLDVVGFPTPIFKRDASELMPIRWNIYLEDEHGQRLGGAVAADRQELTEVAEVGTGCILIARRVLEHPDMRGPFADLWDEDGIRRVGEDLVFCQKAKAAGFKVWAALNYQCGHAKTMDLRTVQWLLDQAEQRGSSGFVSPVRAFKDKRQVFCVSPGRCGTAYLARMLDTIPGVHAEHEPEPAFHHALRAIQTDPGQAARFWLEEKLPTLAANGDGIYVETSHLFAEGFAESLLDLGLIPDLIVLRRPHREVALSMWRRNAIPGRSELGTTYHIGPDDPVSRANGWQDWTDYQLCYWFCVMMEARARRIARQYRTRGATVHETTLAEIVTEDGFKRLVGALKLPAPDWDIYRQICERRINANPAHLAERMPPGDLDAQEAVIHA